MSIQDMDAGCEASSSKATTSCAPPATSFNILRDIFLGHHSARSRISVFHVDLPTIKNALDLHAILHNEMSLIECRHAFLHHIMSGACADYEIDASTSPRPQQATCRSISRDFPCAAEISQTVFNIILGADHKQMPTEHLSHVAAALNISISGKRNLRFKLRASIRKILTTLSDASEVDSLPSASVADFFNSFESHHRPVLLSIRRRCLVILRSPIVPMFSRSGKSIPSILTFKFMFWVLSMEAN
jgi:hypothetical protein